MADERQFTELVRHVHAIADDELVRTIEALEIGADVGREVARLVQQHGGEDMRGTARRNKILGEGEGASRFENVVDEQDVAAFHFGLDVAQHLHLPR